MRTEAYFSILFSLHVWKKSIFSKKYGVPGFSSGNTDFSLPELPVVPDVGKIRKIRKNRKIPVFITLSYWMDYCSKFKVKSMIGEKVMAKSFCEDLTSIFRKFYGWFQLMANNFDVW